MLRFNVVGTQAIDEPKAAVVKEWEGPARILGEHDPEIDTPSGTSGLTSCRRIFLFDADLCMLRELKR